MNRSRLVMGVVLTAAIALFGLTGCARLLNQAGSDNTTTASWDAQALESAGFSVDDVTDPTATPAPNATKGGGGKRFQRLKFAFQHTLHGEATVQTEEGLKTVVVQRGTVTAKSDTSITVKSSDGYTLTWAIGSPFRVIVNRAKSDLGSVAVNSEVGIAGTRDGDTVSARLLVVPQKQK